MMRWVRRGKSYMMQLHTSGERVRQIEPWPGLMIDLDNVPYWNLYLKLPVGDDDALLKCWPSLILPQSTAMTNSKHLNVPEYADSARYSQPFSFVHERVIISLNT